MALSDEMLAYAMTMALPELSATLKQTLWLRPPLTSAEVASAVQAEWARRQTDSGAGNALYSSSKFNKKGNNSAQKRNNNKWNKVSL